MIFGKEIFSLLQKCGLCGFIVFIDITKGRSGRPFKSNS